MRLKILWTTDVVVPEHSFHAFLYCAGMTVPACFMYFYDSS